ncbi:Transposable element Tc1 transposase [Anthophora retusa]
MSGKKSETTKSEREIIVKLHAEGKSYKEIGAIVGRSKSTVCYIIKKINMDGNSANKVRSGRPKKLTPREEKAVLREVKKNPFISAPKLAAVVTRNFNKEIHAQLCRRILWNNNIHGRVPRKKPYISKKNKQLRLNFAKAFINKDTNFWNTVIFSNESKFNLFGSDGRQKVWRKPNTELELKNLRSTVKHGGGSVMVWGCMSANGPGNLVFIDGTMDKIKYLNILKENLINSSEKLGVPRDFYFQQDRNPKHTAKIVQEWLIYNILHILPSPPQSPDLNPIEHLWEELDRRLRTSIITSKDTLKQNIMDAWNSITSDVTKKLVHSMENRLRAVIKAKGGPTKY